jgi:hypothetical protein
MHPHTAEFYPLNGARAELEDLVEQLDVLVAEHTWMRVTDREVERPYR